MHPIKENVRGLPTCSDQLLWDTWLSSFHLPTLTVADEMGLFAFMEKRELEAAEIAENFKLSPRAVEALLGLLASLGYLVQHRGKFSLSESSRNFLLPSSLFYWGGLLHVYRGGVPTHDGIKQALLHDTAEPETVDGEAAKTLTWERFTGLMHSHSFPAAMGLARQGCFAGITRLLDVAGGSGCFCIALALYNPNLQCTILELPAVCRLAEEYIKQFGVQGQIDTYPIDMFKDPLPYSYDGILFANIFHDWPVEQCIQLGEKAFACLPSGGQIFLHEMLLNEGKDGPLAAASLSMAMLTVVKGKQFTAGELEILLNTCGFVEVSVRHSYGYYSLITAKKP